MSVYCCVVLELLLNCTKNRNPVMCLATMALSMQHVPYILLFLVNPTLSLVVCHTNFTFNTFIFGEPNIKFGCQIWFLALHFGM